MIFNEKRLLLHFSQSILAQAFSQLLILIAGVLSYTYFSKEDRGVATYFLSIWALVSILIFNSGPIFQKKIIDSLKSSREKYNIIFYAYITKLISIILIFSILFIYHYFYDYSNNDNLFILISIFLFSKIIIGPLDENYYMATNNLKKVWLRSVQRVMPSFLASVSLFIMNLDVFIYLFIYLFLELFFLSIFSWERLLLRRMLLRILLFYKNIIHIKKFILDGIPVWLMSFLYVLSINLINILLGNSLNFSLIAEYSLAFTIFIMGVSIASQVEGYLIKYISDAKNNLNIALKTKNFYALYFLLMSVVGVILINLSSIIPIVFGNKYENSSRILIFLCLIFSVRSLSLFRVGLYSQYKSFIALQITCIKSVIEIFMIFLLLSSFSYYAVVISYIFSYLFYGIVCFYFSHKFYLSFSSIKRYLFFILFSHFLLFFILIFNTFIILNANYPILNLASLFISIYLLFIISNKFIKNISLCIS